MLDISFNAYNSPIIDQDDLIRSCERPRKKNVPKKKRFVYLLGHLSFWVSGVESPLFFFNAKKEKEKTKYITELFSSLIEQKLHNWKIEKLHSFRS